MTGPLAATFRKPFDEQVAAFRLRAANLVGTIAWDDLVKAQHDRAFVVAGALKADLLADLAAAVDRAISEGTGLEAFRRDFRAIVEKNGWHGWTGEDSEKGRAWRTRVIYRTNMATSYAAGRMAQLVDGNFKFWVYRHGGSLEPRLQHLAWNGVALPPDHPFWAEHYPPNGWGCSCRVFGTNSEAGIRRVGGDPGKALPDDWQVIDPRTGAPVGISKGWDYAPGASVADPVLVFRDKAVVLPATLGAAFAEQWPPAAVKKLADEFSAFVERSLSGPPRGEQFIVGALAPRWVQEVTRLGVAPQTAEIAVTDKSIWHTFRSSKKAPLDKAWYRNLPIHLRSPKAVILDLTIPDAPAFLLVYGTGPGSAKLVIRVNYRLKKIGLTNLVETGQIVDTSGIKGMLGHGYELIEGSV